MALLDSAGVPFPAIVDATLILLSAARPDAAYFSAILAIVGSLIGTLFLYGLARKGGQLYLDQRTAAGRGAMLRRWFQQYGLLTVYIPALLPIPMPMKIPVLCSGALGVRVLTFTLVLLAARIPRYLALAYLGRNVGQHSVAYLKDHVQHLLGLAAALFLVLFLLVRWVGRRRARQSEEPVL